MAYQTGWSPIVELEKGGSVSNKLTTTFANIDTALDAVEDLEVVTADNITRLDALEESKFTFTPSANLLVDNTAYDDAIGVEHIVTAPLGTVMYGYSITFSGTVSDKLWIEMTVPNIDGTAGTPFEHIFEVKDSAEVRPKYYAFPRTHTVALVDAVVKLRFRKGSGDADFNVNFIDLMTEIKN